MNTNLPTYDNADEMIGFLKSFSTADALRDYSLDFCNCNFSSKSISTILSQYPSVYDLCLYDGEKLPGIGAHTLNRIRRLLRIICESISPPRSVVYENQYFQIQVDTVSINIWNRMIPARISIINNHPYAASVYLTECPNPQWLSEGTNSIEVCSHFVLESGFRMYVECDIQYKTESNLINDISIKVNVPIDEFKNNTLLPLKYDFSPIDSVFTYAMPSEPPQDINYYKKLKSLLSPVNGVSRRDKHLLFAAYRCNVPHMIQKADIIDQKLIWDIMYSLDSDYGIAEKYSAEIIKFFAEVYEKEIAGYLSIDTYNPITDSALFKGSAANIVRRIFDEKEYTRQINHCYVENQFTFNNNSNIDFYDISYEVSIIQNGIVIDHRNIHLKAFKNGRREVVSFKYNAPAIRIELDSFTYHLNKLDALFEDVEEDNFESEF